MNYLRFMMDENGIHKTKEKYNFKGQTQTENRKQLRSFLELTDYYNMFKSNLSILTEPLNKLLCKHRPFV